VLGVFGELKIVPGGLGYESSVRVLDLDWIEKRLTTLWSPQWPKELPAIDAAKRDAGRALFVTYCASCHKDINRTDPGRKVRAVMVPLSRVGTDPTMATNFANRRAKTGALKGHNSRFLPPAIAGGVVFGDESPGDEVLVNAIIGTILHSQFPYKESDLMTVRRPALPVLVTAMALAPGPSYKARPLNGIWATAPYFHNGSAPTVYHVLNSKARPKIFTRSFKTDLDAYDSEKVGWKVQVLDKAPDPATMKAIEFRRIYDTSQAGRGNGGHTFGDQLSDAERQAVIEYLKTL